MKQLASLSVTKSISHKSDTMWNDVEFPSIDLAKVDSGWSLQNRNDAKYLVELVALQKVFSKTELDLAQLEINGIRCFTYETNYFDSVSFESFRQHRRGQRKRFKFRHRHYVDSDLHRLEVKMKIMRWKTKKLALENHEIYDESAQAFLRESLLATYGNKFVDSTDFELLSAAQMTFKRQTLVNLSAQDRITIDTDFVSTHGGRSLVLKPEFCIVEVKSENRRSQLHHEFLGVGARSRSFSKYRVTIESLKALRSGSMTSAELEKFFRIS